MKIHVEIFIASRILGRNKPSFSVGELLGFTQKEFRDTRSGVGTHVSAVCVANAPLNHPTGYNYLWRVERDELRPFRPGADHPDPERVNYPTQPQTDDVPEKYRYLLTDE
jgi:hypothetical protein